MLAIVQLSVFEAVNAITGDYEPYLDSVAPPSRRRMPPSSRPHRRLKNFFPLNASLDSDRDLAAIPDGPAKTDGIASARPPPPR